MEIISLTNSSWLFKCTYWIPCIAYWNLETFSKGVIFLYPMKDGGMWESKHISRKKIPIFFVVKVYLVRWYKENVNITIFLCGFSDDLIYVFCLKPTKEHCGFLDRYFFKKIVNPLLKYVSLVYFIHISGSNITYFGFLVKFWLCRLNV